jgi:DNA-binding CsgD family transcriptional regulator
VGPEVLRTPLVGRDAELTRLRGLVAEIVAGRGRSVWVEGEPGIGKSALLAAGLSGAREAGCEVFWDAADEACQRFPLWTLMDCLRLNSRSAAREVAEVWQAADATAVTPGDATTAAAERLFVMVERCCAASPVMLVVDDLQWADGASLALWGRLQHAVRQLPLLLVGACRPVPVRAELAALRDGLTGTDTELIELGPLDGAEVGELVTRLAGAPPGPRLLRQAEQAGGHPLYLQELVDALLREQAVRVSEGVAEIVGPRARGPVSLAAAIARRLRFLPEHTTGILRLAALLGQDFTLEHLRVVTGAAPADVATVVREAEAAGVLARSGPQLAFRHGLIRQALYDGIPAALRSALHQHAARALAAAGAPVERVAEQLLAAPQATDAWMADWVVEAAPTLIHRAPQVAVELLERVRDAGYGRGRRRERLSVHLINALFLLGRYDAVEKGARPVLEGTRDAQIAGRMAWVLGYTLLHTARHAEALEVMVRIIVERGLTGVWPARVRALQALTLMYSGRFEEANATLAQAEAAARQAGDRLALGYTLHTRSLVQVHRQRDQAAILETIEKGLAVVGDDREGTDLRLRLLGNRTTALSNLGRAADAHRAIGHALAVAERDGTPPQLASTRLHAADHNFFQGRWDDALAELDAAAPDLDQGRDIWRRGVTALIAAYRDDRASAARQFDGAGDLNDVPAQVRYYTERLLVARALATEREGHLELALRRFMQVFDPTSTGRPPKLDADRYLWLPDVVRLALATGDAAAARLAGDACAAEAARQPLPMTTAAADHCRGLRASDPAPVLAAADAFERIGYPLFRACALENAAVLLAGRGDLEAARSAHADAVRVYSELDAAWCVLRTDARLRPLGLRRGSRGPRQRATVGWAALTPTEVKIAELVAEGRSNTDVATELFLSRRTVQSHVSHILAKLGAHSRVDIAREVTLRRQPARTPRTTA